MRFPRWLAVRVLVASLAIVLGPGVSVSFAAEPKVEEVRLENGLTVLLRPLAGARSTALVVLFDVGQDHDPVDACGLAHLMEHLYVTAAAGKTPARTAEALMRSHPLGSNAQTGDDYTVIATVFAPSALEAEVEEAAARMGSLAPTDADLQRELPRVREEVDNMHGGMPALAAFNLARERLRKPVKACPRLGGDADALDKVTTAIVRERWATLYRPANATLVIAGAMDVAKAKALVEKAFAGVARGENPRQRLTEARNAKKPAAPAPDAAGKPGAPAAPADARESHITSQPVRSRAPGMPKLVSLAVPVAPLSTATGPAAAQLVVIGRLFAAAQAKGNAFPPPVWFTPIDAPDALCLAATVADGESPEAAVARLEQTLSAAATGPVTAADRQQALGTFGFLLGLVEHPDTVLAGNPYGVAYGLARRRQMGLEPAKLAAALAGVTDADLAQALPHGPGKNPAVVVIP